ncbi:tyrosine kinase-like protein [Cystoisospora suis]|uniref:Tyrosine kinase-like protein n=1 Tax=Cystoisospora suis TaxID=483139 RepID=A0A2C6KGK5_9APIC|nr:tyrosine kinase-like protein [Cystoisospora suis]
MESCANEAANYPYPPPSPPFHLSSSSSSSLFLQQAQHHAAKQLDEKERGERKKKKKREISFSSSSSSLLPFRLEKGQNTHTQRHLPLSDHEEEEEQRREEEEEEEEEKEKEKDRFPSPAFSGRGSASLLSHEKKKDERGNLEEKESRLSSSSSLVHPSPSLYKPFIHREEISFLSELRRRQCVPLYTSLHRFPFPYLNLSSSSSPLSSSSSFSSLRRSSSRRRDTREEKPHRSSLLSSSFLQILPFYKDKDAKEEEKKENRRAEGVRDEEIKRRDHISDRSTERERRREEEGHEKREKRCEKEEEEEEKIGEKERVKKIREKSLVCLDDKESSDRKKKSSLSSLLSSSTFLGWVSSSFSSSSSSSFSSSSLSMKRGNPGILHGGEKDTSQYIQDKEEEEEKMDKKKKEKELGALSLSHLPVKEEKQEEIDTLDSSPQPPRSHPSSSFSSSSSSFSSSSTFSSSSPFMRRSLMLWPDSRVYCGDVFASSFRHGCGFALYGRGRGAGGINRRRRKEEERQRGRKEREREGLHDNEEEEEEEGNGEKRKRRFFIPRILHPYSSSSSSLRSSCASASSSLRIRRPLYQHGGRYERCRRRSAVEWGRGRRRRRRRDRFLERRQKKKISPTCCLDYEEDEEDWSSLSLLRGIGSLQKLPVVYVHPMDSCYCSSTPASLSSSSPPGVYLPHRRCFAPSLFYPNVHQAEQETTEGQKNPWQERILLKEEEEEEKKKNGDERMEEKKKKKDEGKTKTERRRKERRGESNSDSSDVDKNEEEEEEREMKSANEKEERENSTQGRIMLEGRSSSLLSHFHRNGAFKERYRQCSSYHPRHNEGKVRFRHPNGPSLPPRHFSRSVVVYRRTSPSSCSSASSFSRSEVIPAGYCGQWNLDKRSGWGVCTRGVGSFDLTKYEGQWKDDFKDGSGVETLRHSVRYVGQFKRGLREGRGVLFQPNGSLYAGVWSQGVLVQQESLFASLIRKRLMCIQQEDEEETRKSMKMNVRRKEEREDTYTQEKEDEKEEEKKEMREGDRCHDKKEEEGRREQREKKEGADVSREGLEKTEEEKERREEREEEGQESRSSSSPLSSSSTPHGRTCVPEPLRLSKGEGHEKEEEQREDLPSSSSPSFLPLYHSKRYTSRKVYLLSPRCYSDASGYHEAREEERLRRRRRRRRRRRVRNKQEEEEDGDRGRRSSHQDRKEYFSEDFELDERSNVSSYMEDGQKKNYLDKIEAYSSTEGKREDDKEELSSSSLQRFDRRDMIQHSGCIDTGRKSFDMSPNQSVTSPSPVENCDKAIEKTIHRTEASLVKDTDTIRERKEQEKEKKKKTRDNEKEEEEAEGKESKAVGVALGKSNQSHPRMKNEREGENKKKKKREKEDLSFSSEFLYHNSRLKNLDSDQEDGEREEEEKKRKEREKKEEHVEEAEEEEGYKSVYNYEYFHSHEKVLGEINRISTAWCCIDWDVEELLHFFDCLGLPMHIKRLFKHEDVDGYTFLQLTDTDLSKLHSLSSSPSSSSSSSLGLSWGERRFLLLVRGLLLKLRHRYISQEEEKKKNLFFLEKTAAIDERTERRRKRTDNPRSSLPRQQESINCHSASSSSSLTSVPRHLYQPYQHPHLLPPSPFLAGHANLLHRRNDYADLFDQLALSGLSSEERISQSLEIPACELEIEGRIGEGGYSRVYRARWRYTRTLEDLQAKQDRSNISLYEQRRRRKEGEEERRSFDSSLGQAFSSIPTRRKKEIKGEKKKEKMRDHFGRYLEGGDGREEEEERRRREFATSPTHSVGLKKDVNRTYLPFIKTEEERIYQQISSSSLPCAYPYPSSSYPLYPYLPFYPYLLPQIPSSSPPPPPSASHLHHTPSTSSSFLLRRHRALANLSSSSAAADQEEEESVFPLDGSTSNIPPSASYRQSISFTPFAYPYPFFPYFLHHAFDPFSSFSLHPGKYSSFPRFSGPFSSSPSSLASLPYSYSHRGTRGRAPEEEEEAGEIDARRKRTNEEEERRAYMGSLFHAHPAASLFYPEEKKKDPEREEDLSRGGGEEEEDMKVSIKVFRQRDMKLLQKNFSSELALLSKLSHPNIVMLLGIVLKPPMHGLVMEYVENGSLYDLLHKHRIQLSLIEIIQIARDICLGCSYLHHNGILHCDLKSSNVLLGKQGEVKLCDFGLSTVLSLENEEYHSFFTSSSSSKGFQYPYSTIEKDEEEEEEEDKKNRRMRRRRERERERRRLIGGREEDKDEDSEGSDDSFSESVRTGGGEEEEERRRRRCGSDMGELRGESNEKKKKSRVILQEVHLGCVGTHHWMAPEVLRGEGFTVASDVYSFGLILWEMVTRKIPYENMTSPAHMIVAAGYGGCKVDYSRFPYPLKTILDTCLDTVPEHRPSFAWCAKQFQEILITNRQEVESNLNSLLGLSQEE